MGDANTKFLDIIKKDIDKTEKDIKKLKQDKEMYQDLIRKISSKIATNEQILNELKIKLNTFQSQAFISDHATLRYLERTGIIKVAELKKVLLTDEVLQAIYIGADKVHSNGYEFRIKNGKIVTIINENEE